MPFKNSSSDLWEKLVTIIYYKNTRIEKRTAGFNPQAPVKQKIADAEGKLTDPPQIFDAHLMENTDLSPSRFHFSVSFISRSYFELYGFIANSNE